MDTMERYKIQESIKDVVSILDSAPIHRDLILETTLVQLTNRIPIAHLAIERGLKALIVEAGGSTEPTHGLHTLYRILKECDRESTAFLALAFNDAVGFFGYDVNAKRFGHFRSLDNYLTRVGTDKSFEALRYWAIGETGKGESPIPYISPPIHREILCALWCLFLPSRREIVSGRVERKVREAMLSRRHIAWGDGDTNKERSVWWYMNWLKEHSTCRIALKVAVRRNFAIKEGDEFVSQTLCDAYAELQQTKDPAVMYFLRTLTYLPKGSQKRNSDTVPQVQWSGQNQTSGMVMTPGGTYLGYIEKYADGAWGIEPGVEGFVRISDIAESLADTKAYLVNRLTRQVTVTFNGESKRLRIFSDVGFFPLPAWYQNLENFSDLSSQTPISELEFWDIEHGINPGVEISIELPDDEYQNLASVLKGTVTTVIAHRVSVAGTVALVSRDEIES